MRKLYYTIVLFVLMLSSIFLNSCSSGSNSDNKTKDTKKMVIAIYASGFYQSEYTSEIDQLAYSIKALKIISLPSKQVVFDETNYVFNLRKHEEFFIEYEIPKSDKELYIEYDNTGNSDSAFFRLQCYALGVGKFITTYLYGLTSSSMTISNEKID